MLLLRKQLSSDLDKQGWRRQYAMYECSYCGKQMKKRIVNKKIDSCGCNRKNLRILMATKYRESRGSNKTRLSRKLSFNEAYEIRYLYKSGMFSQDGIAELYNVSQKTIYRIVNNYS